MDFSYVCNSTNMRVLHLITSLIQANFTPVFPCDILIEEGKLKNIRPLKLPSTVGYGFTGIVTAVGSLLT